MSVFDILLLVASFKVPCSSLRLRRRARRANLWTYYLVKVDVPCGFMHLMYHAHFRESPNCLPITRHRVQVALKSTAMDSDSDELQRAIQLSLQSTDVAPFKPSADVIDLTEEDAVWPGFDGPDDMDFWKAIAVSMGQGTSIRIVY
jgi:hypothetical protein